LAILVGAAILGAPASARASLNIYLQEAGVNGGAIHLVATAADFTAVSFSGTYGDFTVSIFGGSSDNDASLSDLLSSTTSVKNNAGASKTLKLYVSQNNYTLPAGSPLNVESGLGGSVNSGALTLTSIFQAFADKNNNLLGMGDFTNGPQTATPSGSTFSTGSANGLFTRTGDFSLTSQVNFTLSGGGKANYSDHENVTAVVPAPGGVVLALTGLPVLSISAWLMRRRNVFLPLQVC
jgi:hypothetical protein